MKKVDPKLIGRIYEAAVDHAQWPVILQDISDDVGAFGSVFITQSPVGVEMIASTRAERFADEFIAEGWSEDQDYIAPLLKEQYPGFRSETAYRTKEEIEALPVHKSFYRPRDLIAGVGTVVQGSGDDILRLAIEGFPSHDAASLALPYLDTLRPHLARASSLASSLLQAKSQAIADSIGFAGTGAAIVSRAGTLKALNARFEQKLSGMFDTINGQLRFADPFVNQQFLTAMSVTSLATEVQSIAPRVGKAGEPFVIHILPLCGAAKSIADTDGVLLLVADGKNASVPNSDVLRLLFDLTPAEARLVRLLVDGRTIAEAAAVLKIALPTARVHLKAAFSKTGVSRQAELVLRIRGFGAPRAVPPADQYSLT